MSLGIIIALVAALAVIIAFTTLLSCKCPHCHKYGLRFKESKVVEKSPVILSQNSTGAVTLRGYKIVRNTTMHCKHCDKDTVFVSEKIT